MMLLVQFITFLILFTLCGCTVRGGFPRFLRKGEASDSAIQKDESNRKAARTELPLILARRDTETLDLEAVGKTLVKKYGVWNAQDACWNYWGTLTTNAPAGKVCDVLWLQDQQPRVRDVAWLLCYKTQWSPK